MDRDEAIGLLKGGEEGVREWNRRREAGERIPDLSGANLQGANLIEVNLKKTDLHGADLRESELSGAILTEANLLFANLGGANLYAANLYKAILYETDLQGADLRKSNLNGANLGRAKSNGVKIIDARLIGASIIKANLSGSDLCRADLRRATLHKADLHSTNFDRADLREADLKEANLREANLSGALLDGADLSEDDLFSANLHGAVLRNANLSSAKCWDTVFTNVNINTVKGLGSVHHDGPSSLSTDTLVLSRGQIPESFLRGCGLSPWEVLSAKFYDPELTPPQFAELQYQIFDAWAKGRSMINGCFVSYSWEDAKFVDKLRDCLIAEGVNVWLDRHDMVAGTIQDQVWRAIQVHHVVILVLSESSVRSDWVENELDMARAKEKAEGRAVLCPVALDDAWKAKIDAKGSPGDPSRPLWRTLTQKLVVDFSGWKTKSFEEAFQKLLRGLKVNYGPGATGGSPPPPSGP